MNQTSTRKPKVADIEPDQRILLRLDILPPGMNGPDGLIRQHFHIRKRVKQQYTLLFLAQKRNAGITRPISTPVRVTYTRYCHAFMDWDNACASFKNIGDALMGAGILSDDGPRIITDFVPKQVKVPRRAAEYCTVLIETINI